MVTRTRLLFSERQQALDHNKKGEGFYDKLGADTKNPKKSALATFIDRSG